eukprot:Seg1232.15 transcript_id=Seg1232.15/GoldUCD/mRNA.D3Y31 product="Pecanex-like protein 3" protein_id=Seg1232.15/GoldUCD/D3Y31
MYLLLMPFILYLVTGASKITLTVYPIVILVTFIIIKLINLRLHRMFDGEESNELESNKDKDIEEGNTGSINASSNDEGAKRTEEIELDVLKKPQSESSETKYGDEENTSEKENSSSGNTNDNANGNTNDNAVSCNPANPVRTILEEADDYELEEGEVRFLPIGTEQDTLEEKVKRKDSSLSKEGSVSSSASTSTLSSTGGRAELVVVDVHKNTQKREAHLVSVKSSYPTESMVKVEEQIQMTSTGTQEDETAEKEEVAAEEQTVSEVEKTGAVKTKPEGGSVSSPFPLNLWRLIDSSSDSSWSSNLSENNQRPNQNGVANVQLGRLANEAKSENVLRVSTNNANNGESQEKAVSLSALEGNRVTSNDIEASQRLCANGARPRSNQGVWFSLPEMEKQNGDATSAGHDEQSIGTDIASGESSHWSSSLKQLNDASTEEGTSDKERDDPKSEPESDPRQDSVEELLDSYERRRLHRRGATRQSFRDVVRERGSLRQRRHRLPSEAAGSSLLGQDEDEASLAIRHMALCHEDTSAGAVHCFQDEFGIWHTYIFGDDVNEGEPLPHPTNEHSIGSSALLRDLLRSSSRRGAESGSTQASLTDRDLFESVYQDMRLSQLLSGGLESRTSTGLSQFASPGSMKASVSGAPPRRYYKLLISKSSFIKIWFDRLALLALLDRYITLISILFIGLDASNCLPKIKKSFHLKQSFPKFCFGIFQNRKQKIVSSSLSPGDYHNLDLP